MSEHHSDIYGSSPTSSKHHTENVGSSTRKPLRTPESPRELYGDGEYQDNDEEKPLPPIPASFTRSFTRIPMSPARARSQSSPTLCEPRTETDASSPVKFEQHVENDGLQVSVSQHLEVVPDKPGLYPLGQYQEYRSSWPALDVRKPCESYVQDPGGSPRTICKLRSTFFLALSLAIAVLAAIAIGAGLSLAKSKKSIASNPITSDSGISGPASVPILISTSASTATLSIAPSSLGSPSSFSSSSSTSISTTTTSTGGLVVPTDQTIAIDCPALNGTVSTAIYMPNASSFKYVTVCGEDCVGEDLFSIWAYSLEACVQACRNMQYVNNMDKVCKAIALRADMQNVGILGGNCYLKTGCSEPIAQPNWHRVRCLRVGGAW